MDDKKVPFDRMRPHMTDRQEEIMNLLAFGDGGKTCYEMLPEDVANCICLSVRSVRYHIENIKELYKVRSMQLAIIRYTKEVLEEETRLKMKGIHETYGIINDSQRVKLL